MADIKIKFGGREFNISGLTIHQSMDLRIGDASLPKDDGASGWRNSYEMSIKTIAIAIRQCHPDITEDMLWEMNATENEMGEARKAILIHAGFRAPEQSIAELRATVALRKIELEELEKTLVQRESKAKETGEG